MWPQWPYIKLRIHLKRIYGSVKENPFSKDLIFRPFSRDIFIWYMSILPKLNVWFSVSAVKGAQNKVKTGLSGLSCLFPACRCPEERSACVKCLVSNLPMQLRRGVRIASCARFLARHYSCTRAEARASRLGLGAVSVHSGSNQTQEMGCNQFSWSTWEEVQRLPEGRTLWNPKKSLVLHFPCLQTCGCTTSPREQCILSDLSGQFCLSSPFGQPLPLLLCSLGRKMCFSVALLFQCAALVDKGQGNGYLSSPWLSNTFGLTPSLYT